MELAADAAFMVAPVATEPTIAVSLRADPPDYELETLSITLQDVAELARSGDLSAGYLALTTGLELAEEAVRAGEPWGRALVARWLNALDRYCETHQLPGLIDEEAARETAA